MKILTFPVLIALLGGCASSEQRLCEAEIKSTLINPETADFYDFHQISDDDLAKSELYSSIKNVVAPVKEGDRVKPGSTFYEFRMRAEGELGNTITNKVFCVADPKKTECGCVPLDP